MYFSIIIPCYRAEKTLGRTLDSVLAQEPFVKEILLIDDGSPDNTAAVAKQYASQHPEHIQYHWQENHGPASARNHGARLAQGAYTIFLDADDTLCEGALETFHDAFQRDSDTRIWIAGYCAVHNDKRKTRQVMLYRTPEAILRAIWFGKFSINGGMVALRTPVLQEVRYPENIRHGEDIVFFSHAIARYGAKTLGSIGLNVYHAPDSLRNQSASILKDQDTFITLLFDPVFIPPAFMTYRDECHARKLISLARVALALHQKPLARTYLKKAFALHHHSFLSFKTLKVCLKAC